MATQKSVTILGLKELKGKLKAFPEATKKAGDKGLRPLAKQTVRGVKSRITSAPRVDIGELVEGIHFTKKATRNGIEFIVRPSSNADRYAIFVEENTRPHFPPIQALQGWADRHSIPVYAVAQKIARDGTKGIHMFDKEFDVVLQNAQKVATRIGQNIIIELRWGQPGTL